MTRRRPPATPFRKGTLPRTGSLAAFRSGTFSGARIGRAPKKGAPSSGSAPAELKSERKGDSLFGREKR